STFGNMINLSNTESVSTNLQMGVLDNGNPSVAWQDNTYGTSDILVQSNFEPFAPTVSIDSISNIEPKWNQLVETSGSVSHASDGDTIAVDWGDGSAPTTGIAITGSSTWGPVSHNYTSAAVSTNPNQIIAKVIDGSDGVTEKASRNTREMTVQKHRTL